MSKKHMKRVSVPKSVTGNCKTARAVYLKRPVLWNVLFVIQTVRIFIKLIYSIISIKRPVLLNVLFVIQTANIFVKLSCL